MDSIKEFNMPFLVRCVTVNMSPNWELCSAFHEEGGP